MPIQLRQICLVAAELRPAVESLTHILGINACFVDEAVAHFGLENTLMAVGSNFLEVVAPVQANTAAGRYLERRQGDGGYMVICQSGSRQQQAEVRERAAAEGVRVAYEADRERWNICQFHPADMIASFLEVDWDNECDFEGNWMPAGGKRWQSKINRAMTDSYLGVELQASDVEALAYRWSRVLGLPVSNSASGPAIKLNNATLRFVKATDGRGPGLAGVDLAVTDINRVLERAHSKGCNTADNSVTICGTRFYLFERNP